MIFVLLRPTNVLRALATSQLCHSLSTEIMRHKGHSGAKFIPYAHRIISCHDVLDNNSCINHSHTACIRPLQAVHFYMHDMYAHLSQHLYHQIHASEQNQAKDDLQIGRHFQHDFPETSTCFFHLIFFFLKNKNHSLWFHKCTAC